jgi:hypothetical protein
MIIIIWMRCSLEKECDKSLAGRCLSSVGCKYEAQASLVAGTRWDCFRDIDAANTHFLRSYGCLAVVEMMIISMFGQLGLYAVRL